MEMTTPQSAGSFGARRVNGKGECALLANAEGRCVTGNVEARWSPINHAPRAARIGFVPLNVPIGEQEVHAFQMTIHDGSGTDETNH